MGDKIFTKNNEYAEAMKPVEEKNAGLNNSEIKRSHPAFGMISAHRTTGGKSTLFGSPIKHNATVRIKIHEACEYVSLHHEHHHATKTVAEVEISEAQWATFVTAMNVGDGVPCTLLYSRDGDLKHMPYIEDTSFHEKLSADLANSVKIRNQQYQDAVDALDAWVKGGMKGGKAEGARIRQMFLHPVDYAETNSQFFADSAAESVENLVTSAKANIDAYITARAMQYPALADAAPELPLIENHSETTDAEEA